MPDEGPMRPNGPSSRNDSPRSAGALWNWLIAFALVAAVAAIYAQTSTFGLVRFDDGIYVAGSAHLREGLTVEGVKWAFSGPFASNYFPLTLISHMLDRYLFGEAYGGHHFSSVALHALNTLLLFFVLQYTTGARIRSACVAALFAVHPLNVESVAWVAERKNVLSTTFWILSLGGYVAYTRRGGVLRYSAVMLLMAAGLLSKPTLVTLPLVFLLLDYWPLGRTRWGQVRDHSAAPDRSPRSLGFLVVEKLPLLALSFASSWMTVYAQRSTVRAAESIAWAERLANTTVAYAQYLGKLVWPTGLTIHYPHPYVPDVGGLGLETWHVGCAALLGVALTVVATRRRYTTVGWLWFVGTLVPTIGLVQVGSQAFADRYTYVPAIGLFIAVAWAGAEGLSRLASARRSSLRWIAGLTAGGVVLALGVTANQQTRYWKDTVTLFEHVLEVVPRNPRIRFNLANEFAAREQYPTAIDHYQIALETDPNAVGVRIGLANTLKAAGETARAIDTYRSVIAIEPANLTAHNNLGVTLREDGQLDAAIVHLRRVVEIDRIEPIGHANLGDALAERGDYTEAIDQLAMAIQAGSNEASSWNKLARTFVAADRLEDALVAYRTAVELRPNNEQALVGLGDVWRQQGRLPQAIMAYRRALRAHPESETTRAKLESVQREAEGSGG